MKPTLGKHKDARGRIRCHTATIGAYEGQGASPALAVEAVRGAVTGALARLADGVQVRVWRGHVAMALPTSYGWAYWIDTCPERLQHTGSLDRSEAMGRALHHLAQNVWEPTVTDDRAFVEELPGDVAREISGWLVFQRAYAALRAEGKSDVECHRLACSASSASDGAS